MYTIAGVTGHVGSAAADALLADGEDVTVLVRSDDKGRPWADKGANVAVVDLQETAALTEALTGSDGLFVLLPFVPTVADVDGMQRTLIDSITTAVTDAEVAHVVLLSSLGADLADAPRIIAWLGVLEDRLAQTGTTLTAVRATHFQEKIEPFIPVSQAEGIFPVFASSADDKMPMVATADVGRVVADALRSPAAQVIDVVGPEYTEREVAGYLGDALGQELEVVVFPREQWEPILTEAGMSADAAAALAGLHDAEHKLLAFHGDQRVDATTPISHTITAMMSR